jgi:hypothetical protein
MNAIKHILKDIGFSQEQVNGLNEAFDSFKNYILDYQINILLNDLEQRFSDKLNRSITGIYIILITILISIIGLFFK